jgi:hypothetical protein
MTLLSLYHTHAEVCLQMASSSKSLAIKERWLELANHWRQKANDSEGLPVSATQPFSQPPPVVVAPKIIGKHTLSNTAKTELHASQDVMMAPNTPAPSLSPSSDDVSNPQLQIEAVNDVTPSLSPSLHGVSNPQPQIDVGVDDPPIELDDDWKRLLADIRGR